MKVHQQWLTASLHYAYKTAQPGAADVIEGGAVDHHPLRAAGRISRAAFDAIRQWTDWATVVALGPGLGRSEELDELVGRLYLDLAKQCRKSRIGHTQLLPFLEVETRHHYQPLGLQCRE